MTVSAQTRPTGHPGYSETLPRAPQSAAVARRFVRTVLAVWGLEHLGDDGTAIITEMVANAVQHTRCDHIKVSVFRPAPEYVRIAVTDRDRTLPVCREADDDEEGGRGLVLVAALAERWGTDCFPWGKRVWGDLKSRDAL